MERLILEVCSESHHEGYWKDTIPFVYPSKNQAEIDFGIACENHRIICEQYKTMEEEYYNRIDSSNFKSIEEWPDPPESIQEPLSLLKFADRTMYVNFADELTNYHFKIMSVDEWFETYKD